MYCCGAAAFRFRHRAAFKAHPLWLYERHRTDSTAEPSSKALRLLCHCKGTVAPSLGNRRQDPQRERKHYGTRDRSRHPRSDTFAEEQTASSRYSDRGRRGHGHSRGLRPRSSRRRVRACPLPRGLPSPTFPFVHVEDWVSILMGGVAIALVS